MKKLVLLPIFALFIGSIMTSCVSKSGKKLITYDVEVIAKDTTLTATAGTVVAGTLPKVFVVTKSGDTISAFIEEHLLLNNKIPFNAEMEKEGQFDIGQITRLKITK